MDELHGEARLGFHAGGDVAIAGVGVGAERHARIHGLHAAQDFIGEKEMAAGEVRIGHPDVGGLERAMVIEREAAVAGAEALAVIRADVPGIGRTGGLPFGEDLFDDGGVARAELHAVRWHLRFTGGWFGKVVGMLRGILFPPVHEGVAKLQWALAAELVQPPPAHGLVLDAHGDVGG